VINLIQAMVSRLDTGRWDDTALAPAALNVSALALGSGLNTFGGLFAAAPAFTQFNAGPYPRPFPKGSVAPG
jgi:hypothetical protein